MNARDGVTISGEAVSINADHDWTIGEKLGSSVTGSAGALALGGREIAADVPAWMSQLGVNFAYNVNAIQKATVGSYALTSPTSKDNPAQKRKSLMAQAFLSGIKNLGDRVFAFLKFQGLSGQFKNYNTQADPLAVRAAIRKKVNDLDTAVHQATPETRAHAQADLAAARAEQERIRAAADAISGTGKGMDVSPGLMYLGSSNTPPFEKFAIAMKLLLSIANGAFKGAERGMTNAQTLQGDVLDQFNYASIVVVNGIITGLTDAQLGLTAAAREEGTAGLTLTFDGGIIAKAARKQSFYAITEEKGAAPAPLIASWVFWASAAAAMIPKAVTFGIGIDKAVAAINEVDKTKVEETL
jgi:hypothetical protein